MLNEGVLQERVKPYHHEQSSMQIKVYINCFCRGKCTSKKEKTIRMGKKSKEGGEGKEE